MEGEKGGYGQRSSLDGENGRKLLRGESTGALPAGDRFSGVLAGATRLQIMEPDFT